MHDRKGNPVAVGDKVMIPATIVGTTGGEEYCNCTAETNEVMFPGENKITLTLNTKQVEKI